MSNFFARKIILKIFFIYAGMFHCHAPQFCGFA